MSPHLSVVTRKGQVTIPADIRRALGLNEGDTVVWVQEEGVVKLAPARFTLESAFGSVEPRQRPEDFEALSRDAKASKSQSILTELNESSPEE